MRDCVRESTTVARPVIATTTSELNHMFHDPVEVIESAMPRRSRSGSVLTSSKCSRGLSTIAQAISNGYVSGTTVVGISTPDQPDNNLSLYPNPATDMTYASVELQQPEVVTMVITDVTGKVVAERNYGEMSGANLLPINTTEFAKGMYMVEVRTGNTVTTSKLIVQ